MMRTVQQQVYSFGLRTTLFFFHHFAPLFNNSPAALFHCWPDDGVDSYEPTPVHPVTPVKVLAVSHLLHFHEVLITKKVIVVFHGPCIKVLPFFKLLQFAHIEA